MKNAEKDGMLLELIFDKDTFETLCDICNVNVCRVNGSELYDVRSYFLI